MSVRMDLFFSLRKWPHDVTFFGLLGALPQTTIVALSLDPAWGLPVPLPNQILDPPLH